MNDDRFEELLREAGRDYHRPPQTPRDEMWTAIVAERQRRHAARRVVPLRPVWRWGLGMAAVFVLGIAIGRWLRPGDRGAFSPIVATGSTGDVAYRVAAAQYLGRTEALLTGFRVDAQTGELHAQFVAQARDLLTSTRLLLDSPASKDPRLKPLLEDLELVLAQIAQLPASRDTGDIRLINQGIDQRSVLTRLRTALPAGPSPETRTQGVS